jgi:hypothetical protein
MRQKSGDVEHPGDEHLENSPGGAPPRAYGLVGPAVSPPDVLRGRGRIFASAGNALLIGFTHAYAAGCARIMLAFRMS